MIAYLLASAVLMTTPILLAAIGGYVNRAGGLVNIGLESMMLAGALVALLVSSATHNWPLALLAALAAGGIVGLLMSLVVTRLGGNEIIVGLGFKISAFPFQIWTPDVYQGAPTPTTAFLAVGSKAAGFVLLLRFLFSAVPSVTHSHAFATMFLVISGITILYGNLCALPQRNLKRLLGYSSISHAGYLLLGVAALNASGQAAILYYLAGYLFTVLAGFLVIAIVLRHLETEDISGLAGLNQRSPLLAATMTISMVSLAGIPPLAGFFGKFLLLKSVVEAAQTTGNHGYYWLVFIALAGVVISLYYYFGVIRAIYWSKETKDLKAIELSGAAKLTAWICIGGIFWLGLFPNTVLNFALQAVAALK